MPIKLERGKEYRAADGSKVTVIAQVPPDTHGNAFVGSIDGNGSYLYKADGSCLADAECAITGPWVEDGVVYQPILANEDGSGTILGERFADENQCRVAYRGKYIAKLTMEGKIPTALELLEPA